MKLQTHKSITVNTIRYENTTNRRIWI